jgi:MoaA/NifB/PqqE/SkfB family radical SAM enzyme
MKLGQEALVRLNRSIRSNRLKFAAVLVAETLGLRYLMVRFDPATACNLRCGMCYFSDPAWFERFGGPRFAAPDIDRLARFFFPQTLQLFLGCAGEPTVYKNWPDLIRLAKSFGVPFVSLTTNAQRLDRSASEQAIANGLDEVVVSAHGVRPDTYERLMRHASYERLHRNLTDLNAVRDRTGGGRPRIRINYTVNPDNLDELDEFFARFGAYRISALQIRPMIDFGDTAYRKQDLAPHLDRYRRVVGRIAKACHARGVTLFANRDDPTYTAENPYAVVYDSAVLRYVGPLGVWRGDFDWRHETYRSYKRRTGFRRFLARRVVDGGAGLVRTTANASHAVI